MVTVKGATTENYDEVMEKAFGGHALQDGEMFHVAGVNADGLWVIDGWETREQCDASGAKLMPVLQEEGLMEATGEPTEFEIHSLKLGK
jgi:hypothetical protein